MADLFNETLPAIWFKVCPDMEALQNSVFTSNITRAQVQTSLYACFLKEFFRISQIYFLLMVYSLLILASLGLLGSLLTLITLTTTKSVYFQSPTYRYFRLLILVQSIVMLASIHSAVRQMLGNPDQLVYGWFFMSTYIEPIFAFVFSNWADFIICYLSVERAVACLLPAHFHTLNGKKCFLVVAATTFVSACIGELPTVFVNTIVYNPQTYAYSTSPSAGIGQVAPRLRVGWTAVKSAALIAATSAAIFGFYAAYKRKVRLQLKTANSNSQQQLQSEWKVTRQLCILQLAQAVPTIGSSLVFVVGRSSLFTQPPTLVDLTNLTLATDDQVSHTLTVLHLFYAGIEFFVIMSFFGHCTHFYMYFICSRPFRAATWEALRCGKIPFCLQLAAKASSVRVHPAAPGTNTRARRTYGSSIPRKRSENATSAATQANVHV